MSLGKKEICRNITSKTQITTLVSQSLLESFVSILKKNSLIKKVKIANFGTFSYKESPKRMGRNPQTKEEYEIPSRNKLVFLTSKKIKHIIN